MKTETKSRITLTVAVALFTLALHAQGVFTTKGAQLIDACGKLGT